MFYLKYRTNKHIIDLAILLFVGLLLVTGCDKQSTPPSEEDSQIEKDGKITTYIKELVVDDNLGLIPVVIDSIDVDETKHVVDIPNAVPFTLPTINGSSIGFFGDFEGTTDTIVVWTDYTRTYQIGNTKKTIRESVISLIGKNQIETCVSSVQPISSTPVRGFAFVLDEGQENSGTGKITLEAGNYSETLEIDAAINTVRFSEYAAILDFKVNHIESQLEVYSPDREKNAYNIFNDGAIFLINFYSNGNKYYGATSFVNIAASELKTNKFTFYGFVPNFISQ